MLHFLSWAFKMHTKNPIFCCSQQNPRDLDFLRLLLANTFGSSVYPCLNKWTWWRTIEWGSRVSDHLNRKASCGILVDLKHNYYFHCNLIFFFSWKYLWSSEELPGVSEPAVKLASYPTTETFQPIYFTYLVMTERI